MPFTQRQWYLHRRLGASQMERRNSFPDGWNSMCKALAGDMKQKAGVAGTKQVKKEVSHESGKEDRGETR